MDCTTGLYYYGARYYDPELGRFTQADTIVPEPGNPQSFNRYSYCDNNPINYTDPTGHKNIFKQAGDWFNRTMDKFDRWCYRHNVDIGYVGTGGSVEFGEGAPSGSGGPQTSAYDDLMPVYANPYANDYASSYLGNMDSRVGLTPASSQASAPTVIGTFDTFSASNVAMSGIGLTSSVEMSTAAPLVATPSGAELSPGINLDNVDIGAAFLKGSLGKIVSTYAPGMTTLVKVAPGVAAMEGYPLTDTVVRTVKPLKYAGRAFTCLKVGLTTYDVIKTSRDKNLSAAERWGMGAYQVAGAVATIVSGVYGSATPAGTAGGVVIAGAVSVAVEIGKQRLYAWMKEN
ncbi:MAG: RHS repeat-associated core domain-containing protein [Candidatus Omnitrophota bacterium]